MLDLEPLFHQINHDFFDGAIPLIPVEWSRRLTRSAGVFWWKRAPSRSLSAGIRLSEPLLVGRALTDVQSILAHECIHAWIALCCQQPRHGHGPLFRRQLERINRQTERFQVAVHHSFTAEVRHLAKYCWECASCHQLYYRQRNTIDPQRHRCGKCKGALRSRDVNHQYFN
ncbi:MAG: SprT-like domain-containing protein [Cyanobacteria bacterium J06642_2]